MKNSELKIDVIVDSKPIEDLIVKLKQARELIRDIGLTKRQARKIFRITYPDREI